MFERRSLKLPITLGVVMIVLLIVLIVGWVVLAVLGAMQGGSAPVYWTLLPVGIVFLAVLLAGVVVYLTLSIKAINLTKRQSNFLDSVTHELKSPIASLKLYLQTMYRRNVTREERGEFFRFMLDDVERLDHLINQLLDAGRVDKTSAGETHEPIELAPMIREIAESVCLRYRVSSEQVHLDLEPCAVAEATVDLDMIFRNLIDNAVKYAAKDPKVEITLRSGTGGTVITRVRDNGRGIPRQQRRKVFSRFVRLGSELEREKPGTGLGLYIVHTLVKKLGGRISIRDRDAESGTDFEVILPGQKIEPAADPEQEKPRARVNVTPTV